MAAPTGQVQPGYVQLNDVAFKLRGPMRPILLTTPPPRFEIGKDISQSEQLLNVITFNGPTSGMGVNKMLSPEEVTFSWSQHLYPFRGGRVLPEESIPVTIPGNEVVYDYSKVFEYLTRLYALLRRNANDYRLNTYTAATTSFAATSVQVFVAPRDVLAYYYPVDQNRYLYVADNTGAANTLYRSLAETDVVFNNLAVSAVALAQWDQKLFRLDNTMVLWSSADNGVTWTNKGALPIKDPFVDLSSFCDVKLRTYYDVNGIEALYAVTPVGLFIHDFTNSKWLQTKMIVPKHLSAGHDGVTWRNDFFFPAGMDLLKYTISDTATLTNIGPSRLDGPPSMNLGVIVGLAASYNELFTLVRSTYTPVGGTAKDVLSLLAWNGAAWRIVWSNERDSIGMPPNSRASIAVVNSENEHYVALCGVSPTWELALFRLTTSLQNPRFITGRRNQLGPLLEYTPWFNAFNDGRRKLGTAAFIRTTNHTASRTSVLRYQLDLDETVTYELYNQTTLVQDNTFNSNGLFERSLVNNNLGRPFDYIRFILSLTSNVATASPLVEYYGLYFLIIPRQRFGYTFTIDIEDNVGRQSTAQLQRVFIETLLPKAAQNPQLVKLVFHSPEIDVENTIYGFITRLVGDEGTGHNYSGRYTLSIIAVTP